MSTVKYSSKKDESTGSSGNYIIPVVSIDLNKSGCTLEKSENGSDIYNLKFN